jgi:FRG domain
MKGQWFGRFSGTNNGVAVLEMDEVGGYFEGRAYVFDDNTALPSTAAFVRIPADSNSFTIDKLPLTPLDPVTMDFTEWRYMKDRFPDVSFPNTADTEWQWDDKSVNVKWKTDIGTFGEASLEKSTARRPSELKPLEIHSWDDFRKYVRELEHYRYIYRGQESSEWRLCTAFHRTERSDLVRFLQVDVAALQQHLSSLTAHVFNLFNPIENAAFISLAQHHGYPTPLLDWTYSPFIGAYFAFKQARQPSGKVRIFIFDRTQWRQDWNQLQKLTPARPHFSVLDAIAINNLRMVPQQALSTVTNVEDIEEYISSKERADRKYLQAIDLPVEQRAEVLNELSIMGINAGSLFPGLDGACDQLKDRFFGV